MSGAGPAETGEGGPPLKKKGEDTEKSRMLFFIFVRGGLFFLSPFFQGGEY